MRDDDDDYEHEQAPISKRKAPGTDEMSPGSVSARGKPHKVPRLGLTLIGASSSSVSASGGGASHEPEATRTQLPALRAARPPWKGAAVRNSTILRDRERERERQKEKEKERTRERQQQDGVGSSRRGLPETARKRTVQAKNMHGVSTARLLKDAQNSSASSFFLSFFRRRHVLVLIHRVSRMSSHMNLREYRRLDERMGRTDAYQIQVQTYVIVHPPLSSGLMHSTTLLSIRKTHELR